MLIRHRYKGLKMKILIAGANGQVGSEFSQLNLDQNIELILCGKDTLDITDKRLTEQLFEHHRPDIVINCAAYTAVDLAEKEPERAFLINETGCENLAIACVKYDVHLIHLSTDYVFDGTKSLPYESNDIPNPINVYGQSKLAGEQKIIHLLSRYTILRVSWVFGQYGNNFVKTMLRLAENNTHLEIINDQLGGPTAANDIAMICVNIAQNSDRFTGILHFSGTPFVSWAQFAEAIFRTAHIEGAIKSVPSVVPIKSIDYKSSTNRPKNSTLKTSISLSHFKIINWQKSMLKIVKLLN